MFVSLPISKIDSLRCDNNVFFIHFLCNKQISFLSSLCTVHYYLLLMAKKAYKDLDLKRGVGQQFFGDKNDFFNGQDLELSASGFMFRTI